MRKTALRHLVIALVLAWGLVSGSPAAAHDTGGLHFHGEQLSQQQSHICFNNCIEQHGTSAKASCAMQCGLASPKASGGGGQDCGTAYKKCRQACGKDAACQKGCKEAQMQCR